MISHKAPDSVTSYTAQFDEIRLKNTDDGNIEVAYCFQGKVAFVTYAYGASLNKGATITLSNLVGQCGVGVSSDG